MKDYLKLFLFGSAILVVGLVIRTCSIAGSNENELPISIKTRTDTVFHLPEFSLRIQLEKSWDHVSIQEGQVHGFTSECDDPLFCPSLSIIRVQDPRVSELTNETLSVMFLKQLEGEYQEPMLTEIFVATTGDGTEVRCFSFSFLDNGNQFNSTSALVKGHVPCLISFTTINANSQSGLHHREKFVKLISDLRYGG